MDNKRTSIFVVDDDPSILRALKRLLSNFYGNVDVFTCAEEFLNANIIRGPACLILDYDLPGLNGLQLQEKLATMQRILPVIFISGKGDICSSVAAMKAGAIDFLKKPVEPHNLLNAVKNALAQSYRRQKEVNKRQSLERRLGRLTHREEQVLYYVVKGYLNKQIAFQLQISEKTVKVHRARVMDKMRADSLAELVRLTEKILQTRTN